jgi:hypothetical protein
MDPAGTEVGLSGARASDGPCPSVQGPPVGRPDVAVPKPPSNSRPSEGIMPRRADGLARPSRQRGALTCAPASVKMAA